jgi:hypothetical protein
MKPLSTCFFLFALAPAACYFINYKLAQSPYGVPHTESVCDPSQRGVFSAPQPYAQGGIRLDWLAGLARGGMPCMLVDVFTSLLFVRSPSTPLLLLLARSIRAHLIPPHAFSASQRLPLLPTSSINDPLLPRLHPHRPLLHQPRPDPTLPPLPHSSPRNGVPGLQLRLRPQPPLSLRRQLLLLSANRREEDGG